MLDRTPQSYFNASVLSWVVFLVVAGAAAVYIFFGAEEGQANAAPQETASTTLTTKQGASVVTSQQVVQTNAMQNEQAIIKTNLGDIAIAFYPDAAPKTVENFLKLAKEGFYDGTRFHRVIKGFMIQGGDPLSRNTADEAAWGTGGPGYSFADEINPSSDLYKTGYVRGVVAMANSGPNTNGSQFFIMQADNGLPPNYTIFGHVTSGMDTVDKIADLPTTGSMQGNRPLQDAIMESVTVSQ